jgi:hypothetical protein
MKEEAKTVCINFRISPKYKLWLDELIAEEKQKTISDYFNEQILLRKTESILKKIIKEAKKRVVDEYKLKGRLIGKIDSPCDLEGVYPEIRDQIKEKWVAEVKKLVVAEFGLESGIEDLSDVWPQIADFTSDYNEIKNLTFIASQKERLRDLAESKEVESV